MEDAEQKKKKDEVVYKCGSFCVLNVPEEPPLQYEYDWVLSRLFKDNKPHAMFPFSPDLAVHAYQWYQELKAQMDGLKAYIREHKGQQFASWTDQFLYGSLLESMRDLLAKLFKALFGPTCVSVQSSKWTSVSLLTWRGLTVPGFVNKSKSRFVPGRIRGMIRI